MDILDIFEKAGALLNGHFLLSSGLHSGQYLQCALVLQHPKYAQELGGAIADKFRGKGITCVAGPALGGIIIAHEVARSLGARCIFGEREDGRMILRRGFQVKPHEAVLIVEDVITTGGSIKELIGIVEKNDASVAGIGAIADRRSKKNDLGYNTQSLIRLDIKTFHAGECPLCKDKVPILKPGSRK